MMKVGYRSGRTRMRNISQEEKRIVGAKLREQTEANNYAWDEMQRALGVGKSAIKSYERGSILPSLPVAQKYAALFETTLENLFGERIAATYRTQKISERKISPWATSMREDRISAELTIGDMEKEIRNLFDRLDITEAGLSHCENGSRNTPYEVAVAYAHILGTSPEKYFKDDVVEKVSKKYIPEEYQEDENIEKVDNLDELENAFKIITEREQRILWKRAEEYTLQELAEAEGVDKERIRQIYFGAIGNIREEIMNGEKESKRLLSDGEILIYHTLIRGLETEARRIFPWLANLKGNELLRRIHGRMENIYEIVAEKAKEITGSKTDANRVRTALIGNRHGRKESPRLQKLRETYFPKSKTELINQK